MTELIYARPDRPTDTDEPTDAEVMSLAHALAKARPGTTIRLLPGEFLTKVKIDGLRGVESAPIIIEGSGTATRISGRSDPFAERTLRDRLCGLGKNALRDLKCAFEGWEPDSLSRSRPFFRLKNASWIEFRELSISGCWPTVFHLRSCDHITVAGCQILGGQHVVYFADKGRALPSHHILIEDNHWCQDPSGPADPVSDDPSGRRIWQEWTWHQFKKKPRDLKGWEDLRFMNGGFVSGEDLAGSVVIRRNAIRFAFNGVRLAVFEDQSKREPLRHRDIGDAPKALLDPEVYKFNYTPPDPHRNTNVEIYNNKFEYIRDNAVEPEYGSKNWWVWNNRFKNVHKAFSIHNNGGGNWYYFGNMLASDDVPPAQLNEPPGWRLDNDGLPKPVRKLGGGVFKLLFGPPLPSAPCFIFHNSWRPRGGVMNHGEIRHLIHRNNAIEHCAPEDKFADLRCPEARFGTTLDGTTPVDYGFATRIPPIDEGARNDYDADVSTGTDFPSELKAQGHEKQGVGAADAVFDPARRAEFALATNSPARGAAIPISLRGGYDWAAPEDWTSQAPDAGARQPDGPFDGPAFAHLYNPYYDEAPRLVATERVQVGLILVFSVPLDASSIAKALAQMAIVKRSDGTSLHAEALQHEGRRLILQLGQAVAPSEISAITLPAGLMGGQNGNLLPVTSWAAILPLHFNVRSSHWIEY